MRRDFFLLAGRREGGGARLTEGRDAAGARDWMRRTENGWERLRMTG